MTGGSRGDFSAVGPDGCLYATQTATVIKVTNADGTCSFAPTVAVPTLRLSPGSQSAHVGSSATITATLTNASPASGHVVTFTVTGANPGVGTATTNSSGTATFNLCRYPHGPGHGLGGNHRERAGGELEQRTRHLDSGASDADPDAAGPASYGWRAAFRRKRASRGARSAGHRAFRGSGGPPGSALSRQAVDANRVTGKAPLTIGRRHAV